MTIWYTSATLLVNGCASTRRNIGDCRLGTVELGKMKTKLTAEEIYSIEAKDYDGEFWVTVEFLGKEYRCEGFSRCEDENEVQMREAGYVYIENSYQFGKELWVDCLDIQDY